MRSRKRRFTGHQFCPPPYRTKMRLHCKYYGQAATPCARLSHARAHMHAAAVVPPPLGPAAFETKVAPTPAGAAAAVWWQIQKHVLVGWRRPRGASELPIRAAVPGATPRGRPSERFRAAVPASDSARPSRERLRADGVPFRRPVLALCAPFRRPDTVRVTPPVRLPVLCPAPCASVRRLTRRIFRQI